MRRMITLTALAAGADVIVGRVATASTVTGVATVACEASG